MLEAMMKLITNWLLSATALLALAHIFKGIEVSSFGSALAAALVIGLFNLIVRPVLVVLTLPVTVLSLGLFLFIINAIIFWWASILLSGFYVDGFGAALLGSLLYSAFSIVIDSALQRLFSR
jgi:putative membrane protein